MRFEDLPYKAVFSSTIKPLVSKEKDKYLALASQTDLGQFIPAVGENDIDLLPIAFNAFVVNRVNKNNDVIDTDTALAVHANFAKKPINLEHDKGKIIGVLLSSGFSEFGTDKPLTLEEAKAMTSPFNVVLGGVIWKVVDEKLAAKIEDTSDPDSVDYGKISASWELGFADYHIVKIKGASKNLEDGRTVSSGSEYDKAKEIFAGSGHDEDTFYYRKPVGIVIPLGIGLTASPAAEVKGVATPKTITPKTDESILQSSENNAEATASEKNNQNIISQPQKPTVNTDKNITTYMKINNISELTPELLKTIEASSVRDFLAEEIKKASVQFEADKTKTEKALEVAQTQATDSAKKIESVQAELKKTQEQLNVLLAEKAEAEKVECFNKRMTSLDEKYELSDEIRKVLASQIKTLADDKAFDDWNSSMSVFLKAYTKSEKTEAEKKAEAEKTAAAATADKVIEDAAKNGKKDGAALPNSAVASSKDKWATALKTENIVIK